MFILDAHHGESIKPTERRGCHYSSCLGGAVGPFLAARPSIKYIKVKGENDRMDIYIPSPTAESFILLAVDILELEVKKRDLKK
jgi:hypothetical protein